MDRLVSLLMQGKHPIEFESRTENLEELKERIDRGFVFVKFTETQGGIELGINLDEESKKLTNIVLNDKKNTIIKIVGTCELNYHKVRCHAEIDLKIMQGLGHLELIDNAVNSAGPTLH